MSEVKNVTITVPVGLNGWQQTGSVVINGMKVEFPMGVETQVPETAAALLKELIEAAEKRAETVPATNDYKGSLTVPAGHTLRVEKGANFLNYGESVETRDILPETVLKGLEDDTNDGIPESYELPDPWTHEPHAGAVWIINYNGKDYECEAMDFNSLNPNMPAGAIFAFGNTSALGSDGIPPMNTDIPFCLMAMANEFGEGEGQYGAVYPMPINSMPSVTLSIREKVKVASAGGGIVFVNVAIGDQKDDANGDIYAVEYDVISIDKTFDELKEAINRGSLVQLNAQNPDYLASYYLQLVAFENDTISFAVVILGKQMVCRVMKSEFDAANVKTACEIGIVQ